MILFQTLVGSRLYNLHTYTSDYDMKGVFLPSTEDILGLSGDDAPKHKDSFKVAENGIKEESVLYSFKKFIQLCMKQNPTVLELAFVDNKYHTIDNNSSFTYILKTFIRHNLVTKKAFYSYGGYIKDQLKLVNAKQAQNNRKLVLEKYGYDVKAASHVYRLTRQAIDLLTNGTFNPTMEGIHRDAAYIIKTGLVTFEQTIDILNKQYNLFQSLKDTGPLPDSLNINLINEFVIKTHKDIINGTLQVT